MRLDFALQLMDKCAEQAQFSVPKQAMITIRKALLEAQKQSAAPTNTESPKFLCNKISRGSSADFCKYVKYVCECSGTCPSKRSEKSDIS